MFADDTTLYLEVDDPHESAIKLNDNLQRLKCWADQWIVKFNSAKTKSMTISNRSIKHPPLKYNNDTLEEVTSHKHLGVIFNQNLSWTNHIDSIIDSVSKMLNVLKRLRYNLDRKTLETIYCTFIRPKLEYASPVWSDCNSTDADKLEKCQITAAKIVSGAKQRTKHELL